MIKKVPHDKLKHYRELKTITRCISLSNFHDSILHKTLEDENGEPILDKDGKKTLVLQVVRDESVQREHVWESDKESDYISYAAIGYAKYSFIHFVVLEPVYKAALKRGDPIFAGLIKFFMDEGYAYAHIDGGNRCDDFISFWSGDVCINPGIYHYQPKENQEVGEVFFIDEENVNKEKLEEKWSEVWKALQKQDVNIIFYLDVSQKERSELFAILNDGEPLNDAERRNRLLSTICKEIREYLNKTYKKLLIDTGCLKSGDAKRYGACAYIADLAHLYMTISSETPRMPKEIMNDNNMVDVKATTKLKKEALQDAPIWASSSVLDADYVNNSASDIGYEQFRKFFENDYVPYLKEQEKMGTNKVKNLISKNIMVDLFYLICYMSKFSYKLQRGKRQRLLTVFHSWQIIKFAKADIDYYVGKSDVTYRKWKQMYSGNSPENMANRFPTIINELIPELIKRNIIKWVDPRRLHNKIEKAEMAVNQKLTLDDNPLDSLGEEIQVMDIFDPTVIQGDHYGPHVKGFPTSSANGKLEQAAYNNEKSDKIPADL